MKLLYLGYQWKELPIATDQDGQPEIHYSSIYRAFRRFEREGRRGHMRLKPLSAQREAQTRPWTYSRPCQAKLGQKPLASRLGSFRSRTNRVVETHGCFEDIFVGSVSVLHEKGHLDTSVIHGDGTTTAAKKGGDNLGFNGHKHMRRDKIVAFCDRNCNVIAPFVTAPGNRNELPLLRKVLPQVTHIAQMVSTIAELIAKAFSIEA